MEFVMQVLGTLGLVETLVEFTYVFTNRENFTPFEEVFFLTSGSIEMLGEVVFLLVGIGMFLVDRDCKDIKALIRDPIHNCAQAMFDLTAHDKEGTVYDVWSLVAIGISLLSLPVWATFWPVWGNVFEDGGDDGLRLALSICCLGIAFILICLAPLMSAQTFTSIVFAAYGMEKVFEVYILLSDLERLCPGDLGKALVGFQTTEIISVAGILACAMWLKITDRW